MHAQHPTRHPVQGVRRRNLLQAGLVAGVTVSAGHLAVPLCSGGQKPGRPGVVASCACAAGTRCTLTPSDPQLQDNTTLSFVYSTLLRHKVGPGTQPGTFPVEPHMAERWETPDDTTYIFHLRQGVQWHNKPPVNGRELVAEDVKFTYHRFLTEPGNPPAFHAGSVDRVEVVDRYTVKFLLNEPFVWLVDVLANPTGIWIIAPKWWRNPVT